MVGSGSKAGSHTCRQPCASWPHTLKSPPSEEGQGKVGLCVSGALHALQCRIGLPKFRRDFRTPFASFIFVAAPRHIESLPAPPYHHLPGQ